MSDHNQLPTSLVSRLLEVLPFVLGPYEKLYKHFHSHPELSLHETQTAAVIAEHPALSAFDIHRSIGGHGVAEVLRNGRGPTILLRADMDALPVEEVTGLDFASTVTVKNEEDGTTQPVMHACGHDMHVTFLLAACEWLAKDEVKAQWTGTLVMVFQPNEEKGDGAKAMVDGGLYDKVPTPDLVLAQHVMPLRSGNVAVKQGTIVAAADSFKVTVYGRGGHGSMPHLCIDPVLLGANIVVRLQGLVSREIDPQEAAVLTIGSLQAGQIENVIADKAVLKIDIRSQNGDTRRKLVEGMKRIVNKECEASACTKPPTYEQIRKFPLTVNDVDVTAKTSRAFASVFGAQFDPNVATSNASEDFSDLATAIGKPYCFWFFGGVEGTKFDAASRDGRIAEDIPVNHSGMFALVIQPTLETGTKALCVAALTHLGSKAS